ncbi:regulatory protein RecX [Sphingobacterium corticibacterium]|uniref:Regulatory protein RecX n=1 Tax=Sphingobacterium corticibacterium TaxID=2484746 RepID=A0A4Q6XYP9_9SPHI|nr:regulatory protein RecX [Sphingobacterium corticibacterium]RZF61696.1 RecX family transcriptional regulator [Sphingobacterium corticibacterium]
MEESKKPRKLLTPLEAKRKAESYCAYQERAQQEVRNKLYEWGLDQETLENIIAQLIEENFLNEERFAKAYTLGRFRMKGWGKIKIKQHLKLKKVSEPLIRLALKTIDMDEYHKKIEETINKKIKETKKAISFTEKSKIHTHLLSKGFENEIISEKLRNK